MAIDLDEQVRRAGLLIELHRADQAETLLRQVLGVDSDHATALHRLSLLCWRRAEYPEATRCAQRLLTVAPDRIGGYLMMGRILLSQDREAEAEPYARRAVELGPHDPPAYCLLAEILGDLDRLDESWAMAEHALQLDPDYADPYLVLIAVGGRTGDWDRAETVTLEALRRHPHGSLLRSWLGVIRSAQGRFDEAREEFLAAVRAVPGQVMLEHVAAMMELVGVAAGQLSDVYDQICRARDRPNLTVPGAAGTDPELLAEQALLAERTVRASEFRFAAPDLPRIARALVDAVLAADPANRLARFLRAQFLLTDEDYDAALPIAAALVEEGYQRAEVYRILVHSQDETGHARDALETAIRAERLHPGDVLFPMWQAHLFWFYDDPEQGTAPARRAVALDPDAAIGHDILAKCLAATGEFDEAWREAIESLVHDPETTEAFTSVAGFGIREFGLDHSTELTIAALAEHPDLLALRIWLAGLYTELTDWASARTNFDQVLAADPPAPLRALALRCLDLFDRPPELAEVYAAFAG